MSDIGNNEEPTKKIIYKVPQDPIKGKINCLAALFKPYSVCVVAYPDTGVLSLSVDPEVSVDLEKMKQIEGIADKYQCELIFRVA